MNTAEQNENVVLVWLKTFGWLLLSQLLYLMYPDRDEKSARVVLKRVLERMLKMRLIFTRVLPDGTLIFLLGERGAELVGGMPGRNLRAVEWRHRLIANWAAIIAIHEGNDVKTEYQVQQNRAHCRVNGKLPDGIEIVHDVDDFACLIEAEAGYKKPGERNKIIAIALRIAAREVTIFEEQIEVERLKIISNDPLSEKNIIKTLEKTLLTRDETISESEHYYLGQSLQFQRLYLTKQHNLVAWETEHGWDVSDILEDYGLYLEYWEKRQIMCPTAKRQEKEMERKVKNKWRRTNPFKLKKDE